MSHNHPGLAFADCIKLLIFGHKEYNQSDFSIDDLVMSLLLMLLEKTACYYQCVLLTRLC